MTEHTALSIAGYEVPTLLRLLKGIERLPDGAIGALVFTAKDTPQGTVLIEDNRVCWAAASNMEHRLTHILRHQSESPLPPESIEEIYQECLRDGIPLGETLVERGVVTAEGLWRGIRQHTAEAICVLATTSNVAPIWASNRRRRYDAQFTFSTAELLSCAGGFGFEAQAEEAELTLKAITPREAVGLAYQSDPARELPLAHVSADKWDCEELIEIGRWARSVLPVVVDDDDGEAPPPEEAVGVVDTVDGRSLRRAWRAGPLLYVRFVASQKRVG